MNMKKPLESLSEEPVKTKESAVRVVEHAYLQAPVMIPGTGQTETTLNSTRIPTIKMTWIKGEGLLISVKNIESFIPSTNIKIIHFKKD